MASVKDQEVRKPGLQKGDQPTAANGEGKIWKVGAQTEAKLW